jgi:hypothetical protein
MKKMMCVVLFAMVVSSVALAQDSCRAKALDAAEVQYGDDPMKTEVTTVVTGQKYDVRVGINNPEDGEYDYTVTFPNGCNSAPVVTSTN